MLKSHTHSRPWTPGIIARRTPAEIVGAPLPKFDRGVSLVGWAYNEEEQVGEFVARAHRLMSEVAEDFEIIVVNDGSTDRTPEILEEARLHYPELRVVHFECNKGIGEAAKQGIAAARKEFLFWQTVDWSYDLTAVRYYLELLKEHDVVAGCRRGPISGGNPVRLAKKAWHHFLTRSDNAKKSFVSICNYLLVRVLFNFPMSDYQNVSFYPSKLIQSIQLEARSSFGNPEFLMKSYWRGASIIEVPIQFLPRQVGEAKGTRITAVLQSIWDIFKLWYQWVVVRRLPWKGAAGSIRRLVHHEWRPCPAFQAPERKESQKAAS